MTAEELKLQLLWLVTGMIGSVVSLTASVRSSRAALPTWPTAISLAMTMTAWIYFDQRSKFTAPVAVALILATGLTLAVFAVPLVLRQASRWSGTSGTPGLRSGELPPEGER